MSPLHEEALYSLIVTMLDKRKEKSRLLYLRRSISELLNMLTNNKLISEKSINNLRKLDLDFYEVIENKSKVGSSPHSSSILEIEANGENRDIARVDKKIQKVEENEKETDYINLQIVFKYLAFYLLFLTGAHHFIVYIFNPNDLR